MWLGIDLGTSGVKAVVVDDSGAVAAQGVAPLAVSRPQPLWSEQDPAEWWAATHAAVLAIAAPLRRQVRGIGLAGQMHGATLLDARDAPLRPAILWNDGRSARHCRALERAVPALRKIAGNVAMPGFTAPKLLWLRQNEPDVFARVCKVLLPKDYLRLRMTGVYASDMSDSAGTLWMDVARRTWSDEILAACSLDRSHMPELFEGPSLTARLRGDVARTWGMDEVPVIAGGGDNAAGAAGIGVVRDGDALLSLGTSGVIFVATQSFRPNPAGAVHAFCHCVPAMWHQMSVHLSAASCVEWAARLFGAADPAAIFAKAEAAGPAAGQELFLPYLSGERTPHNDPYVRGAFLGLDHESDPARLCQAVLEGVALALADGIDALRETGTSIAALSVIGGGARSQYWGTLIAAALGTRLVYRRGGEVGPALGAARLAFAGIEGVDVREACMPPPVSHEIEPNAEIAARLGAKRERFRAAYEGIRANRDHDLEYAE